LLVVVLRTLQPAEGPLLVVGLAINLMEIIILLEAVGTIVQYVKTVQLQVGVVIWCVVAVLLLEAVSKIQLQIVVVGRQLEVVAETKQTALVLLAVDRLTVLKLLPALLLLVVGVVTTHAADLHLLVVVKVIYLAIKAM
jgi:hypothetical protein